MKRFIWYEEALEFPDLPHYHIVGIEGRVEGNKLGIFVMMFGGGDVEVEYFNKIIDTRQSDLDAEVLQEQFMGKVARIKQTIGDSWVMWLQDYERRLRQYTGQKVYYDFQQRAWLSAPVVQPSDSAPAQ